MTRFLLLLIFLISFNSANSQIKVFERTDEKIISGSGLFFESSTRNLINLNGKWEISFGNSERFDSYSVPLAYDFSGDAIFKRSFSIDRQTLDNFDFILVAEGISYKADVKINNNLILTHIGSFTSFITPILSGVLSEQNEIVINVNSELTYDNTLPLANQINFSKVYGGITKDIYIVAVPKVHVQKINFTYSKNSEQGIRIKNFIDVQAGDFIHSDSANNFFIQTKIINKSTNEETASDKLQIQVSPNTSGKFANEFSILNPQYWSPSIPAVYKIVTLIFRGEELVDEFITESGFTSVSKFNEQLSVNGQPFKIKGINYYEDSPRFASALEYYETERDLQNIKSLGFNCIRIPGRSAHPYIVSLCNKLGLFLLQEIPFNDVPEDLVSDERYIRLALGSLNDIIIRDRNNPCIFAWGIGNDFFVNSNHAMNYVKSSKSLIDSIGKKMMYYTSGVSNPDICSGEADFVGINIYKQRLSELKKVSERLLNNSSSRSERKSIFISRYGVNIDNNNNNGYSDEESLDAQVKYLTEGYKIFQGSTFGVCMNSYADWNSERPLNYPLTLNPYMYTDGIYNFYREQKRAPEFVKRLLNEEELPRINEGSFTEDYPYIFIVTGLTFIILFLFFINNDRKFRKSIGRSFYKVQYFFYHLKEQLIIPFGYNILLMILVSAGIALFFSSIFYFYKKEIMFDLILANFITNDSFKIWISNNFDNKYLLIVILILLNILCTLLTVIFIYSFTFYMKGKFYLKNIYTIVVWASLSMIVMLPVGTVLYKLAGDNPSYIKFSIFIFAFLYLVYLIRLLKGIKIIFEVKALKAYFYGGLIIVFIFGVVYYYFFLFTSAVSITKLVLYLN